MFQPPGSEIFFYWSLGEIEFTQFSKDVLKLSLAGIVNLHFSEKVSYILDILSYHFLLGLTNRQ